MVGNQKFTEAKFEDAIIQFLAESEFPHTNGCKLVLSSDDVLIRSGLREFLASRYAADHFYSKKLTMNMTLEVFNA